MKKRNAILSVLCASALVGNMLAAAMIPASAAEVNAESSGSAAVFTFTDSEIKVSDGVDSSAYSIEGTALTIKKGGSYTVTGSCADGSVKVKKSISDVELTLSDLTLTSTTTAPVTCNKNSQVDIIVKGEVTLEDNVKNSEDYWYDQGYTDSDTELDSAENAVVKLKGASKVTISGDGTLNIKANAKNGIKSGSTLDSDLETEVAPDSSSEYYAYLTMRELTVNIDTTNVYKPTSSSSSTGTATDPFGGGMPGGMPGMPGGQEEETYGDGINAECCLNVESGTYNVSAGDDGIKSDYYLNIGAAGADNGSLDININESYEGLEGAVINIYSGDIDIYSSDDAINAANGDLRNFNFALNIYGGDIYADASQGSDNDGLDSNGTISIYGGRTVTLSDSGGNAVDLESTLVIDGGYLLGIGAYPMDGGTPTSTSKQSWAVWSGSNGGGFGPGGGGRPGRPGEQGQTASSGSTNISSENQSRVTLTSGSTTGIAIGSAPNVTANSKVAVMLDGTTELIGTTARVNASYVIFAGDIDSAQRTATVTFNANGSESSVTANVGDTIKIPECNTTVEGSTFKEWNTKEDGTGASYKAGDEFTVSSDSTLYAVFESSEQETGYVGTFVINGGQGTVTVYNTQEYKDGAENVTTAYARDGSTGEISTDGSGQINFKVVAADGYEVESVTADANYKNVKGPADTGAENTYRVTKITGDVTITVTLKKSETADSDEPSPDTDTDSGSDTPIETEPFVGTFVVNGGQGTVTVYNTQEYKDGAENVTTAYARDGSTGEISTDGSGQINFKVVAADGYEVESVTADANYKNVKGPADTGAENTYRVTKITGDVTITVTLKAAETADSDEPSPDTDTDSESDTPPEAKPFTGTFAFVGGEGTVTVYTAQDLKESFENADEAYARDGSTGEIVNDGSGQINFKVVPADGYEVESVTADANYKNVKTPADTGAENVYRVTKITGDVTITITLKKSESTEPVETKTEPDPDTDTDPAPVETEPFKGTFVVTGGEGRITVYNTQEYKDGTENATTAYARDGSTGEIVTDGSGQINFKVVPADGYEVESVTADKNCKNVKTPEDTGAENVYRVTKITGDVNITVTLKKKAQNPDEIPDITDETKDVLFGDTTLDGTIFSDDALLALRHSLGLATLEDIALAVGDVNQDGIVDSGDALLILRYSVGLTDEGSLAGVTKTISLTTYKIK